MLSLNIAQAEEISIEKQLVGIVGAISGTVKTETRELKVGDKIYLNETILSGANAGTQILKELRRQAPLYWKQKYNDNLLYLITFVAGGNNGAVYKADNWSQIGQTSGVPPHKSISMKWDTHESLKEKYVKPTGENKKLIFFKRIRTKQEHLSSKT